MGACQAPGGDFYYIWTNPDEVYQIPINPSDPNQLGFVQAIIAREDAIAQMRSGAGDAVWEAVLLGATVAGFPYMCASLPLAGCVIDGIAIIASGGLLLNSGADFREDLDDYERHSRQSEFYLCKMRGLSDSRCRELAGITSGDLEGTR